MVVILTPIVLMVVGIPGNCFGWFWLQTSRIPWIRSIISSDSLKAPLRGLPPWPRQSLLHPCSCPGYLQHFGPHALLPGFVKGVTVTMSESCVFCLGKKRQDIYRNHVAIPLIKNLGLVKMEELQGYSSNNHGNHGPEKKIIFGWVESCAIAALAPLATTTTTTTTTTKSIQILLGGLDFCLAP